MAANDARPVPRKNAAWRFYFAVRKNDGTLITSWTGQDSEVSLDGASFSDCTNEATEIGTSGCGYLDLTAAEMNADAVVLKITVTNTSALPIVVTLFPEEAGDYRGEVTSYASGMTPLQPTTAGRTLDVSAGGEAGIDWANVGSPTTALNLSGTTISTSQAVASVSGSVGSVTGSVGSISGVAFPTNFAALAITAGGAVTAGTVSDKSGYSLTQAFPSNFASLGINASGHISRVVLCDTTTTNTDTITAAGIRSAVGLASANLDTQLTTIDDLLDSEVASIIASLSTIVGHVDTLETEVAKIIKTGQQFTATDGTGSKNVTFTRI